ncbi:MAG: tetratricopeptide repeat protein [Candidatus Acidiferrales bacterium]
MRIHFATVFIGLLFVASSLTAQNPSSKETSATSASSQNPGTPAERAIQLARTGHCAEAVPLLKKANASTTDKDSKREIGQAGVRCSMTLGQSANAVEFLSALNREFPHDPAVLYLATHVYSDLSLRASQELAATAPHSHQAMQLEAEALEEQGKWDDARAEYEQILKEDPKAPGIHYSIGQIILSKPPTPTTGDDAKVEFEAELQNDPTNAGAEYVLGELARRDQQWDQAIGYFSRAIKNDAAFADAYRGLGMSYNAAEKYQQAIAPLEQYVKMQPRDPAGHYQLAIAYARVGKKEQAAHEMDLQRQLDAKARAQQNGSEPGSPQ